MESLLTRCTLLAVVYVLTPSLCQAQGRPEEKHDLSFSFRVPESTATYPLSINEAMTVTGYYVDKSGVTRGFVRYDDGHVIAFDVPGSVLTMPTSINAAGDVTGYYEVPDSDFFVPDSSLGFIRDPDGKITTFGVPENPDEIVVSLWAQPVAINVSGEIAGNFPSIAFGSQVFVRSPTGTLQGFTLSQGAIYSTIVTGLNAGGAVVGYFSSQGLEVAQGFYWDGQGPVPDPYGGYTPITVPGSTGTFPTGINAEGAIVGCYSTAGIYHDFVLSTDGVFTTLDLSGTIPPCLAGGSLGFYDVVPPAVTINDEGTVTGFTTNAFNVAIGFVRFSNGKTSYFAFPGSKLTMPTSLNNRGVITGYYSTENEIVGFIHIPK